MMEVDLKCRDWTDDISQILQICQAKTRTFGISQQSFRFLDTFLGWNVVVVVNREEFIEIRVAGY